MFIFVFIIILTYFIHAVICIIHYLIYTSKLLHDLLDLHDLHFHLCPGFLLKKLKIHHQLYLSSFNVIFRDLKMYHISLLLMQA
ncbi:hypothetical protein GLOIN_2v1512734 [Rhizophagus irregularis DAOM 181602=DAOM 197198]|uniref:Uncharacterized protein n=1 Tax=Rhizophagus irregularis (strain DAOM 181602 / DAOM 197198 / MUCL 43194) TaxID=747089 RepID=A0A2P4QT22_RHIID|nr:hypothetical protein GLOIN_2v1512734 [Rhizophagus irregularis DAOM 181602=DAOM 197198]POG80799.1 hypothetical protein GLOIN_2v1512734 [Rhizophagus irregularis DAOM 181602=DAOM 197198]|eukprot:XP_025187665.1 hypothetical protein GLOIN_2v1512734 [Rhizophagus irregularis DAOM 181602=DAOM 197198]